MEKFTWKFYVKVLIGVWVVLYLIFLGYLKFIRTLADERVVLAESYLNRAEELKEDFYSSDGDPGERTVLIETVTRKSVDALTNILEIQTNEKITRRNQEILEEYLTLARGFKTDFLENDFEDLDGVITAEIKKIRKYFDIIEKTLPDIINLSSVDSNALLKISETEQALNAVVNDIRKIRGAYDFIIAAEMAIENLRIAVIHDNKYEKAYYLLGRAYRELGLIEDEGDAYAKIAGANPGSIYIDEIKEYYEDRLKENEDDIEALYTLGRINRHLGNNDEALKHLNSAIEKDKEINASQSYVAFLAEIEKEKTINPPSYEPEKKL